MADPTAHQGLPPPGPNPSPEHGSAARPRPPPCPHTRNRVAKCTTYDPARVRQWRAYNRRQPPGRQLSFSAWVEWRLKVADGNDQRTRHGQRNHLNVIVLNAEIVRVRAVVPEVREAAAEIKRQAAAVAAWTPRPGEG